MLGRLALGASASASALLFSSQVMVAEAAVKPTKKDSEHFAPVYDDEVISTPDPLPGTTVPAKPLKGTKVDELTSKINQKLQTQTVEANGQVFKVSKALESYTREAREQLNRALGFADARSQNYIQKYREGERHAADVVAGLKSPQEQLLPESIYVLVAGLSGTIFARKRNFVVRTITPLVFGTVAFWSFLPKTFENTRNLLWHYEKQQLPSLAEKHAAASQNVGQLKEHTVQLYADGEKQMKSGVKSLRQKLREWINI